MLALAPRVQAQAQTRPPLVDRAFNLDFVNSSIGSGRVMGLGGAYSAIATGPDGAAWSPAAIAARDLWDTSWLSLDLTADISTDLFDFIDIVGSDQRGYAYGNFTLFALGARLVLGDVGFAVITNTQTYDVGDANDVTLTSVRYGGGYSLFAGQLVLGLSARSVSLRVTDAMTGRDLVELDGTGPEVGALLALEGQPYRLGVAVRAPVDSKSGNDVRAMTAVRLPENVSLPWELQLGFAYQVGPRPLNRRFVNPHDDEAALRKPMLEQRALRMRKAGLREPNRAERWNTMPRSGKQIDGMRAQMAREPAKWRVERALREEEERAIEAEVERLEDERDREVAALSRDYLLLTSELILTGPTERGVGLASFLEQVREDSGKNISIGVRFGAETEPLAHWIKARAGMYLEPSRFEGVGHRVHGTAGFDVRLFTIDLWGLVPPFTLLARGAADVANQYLKVGVGIGNWH